ncbi:hypothetical protein NL676_039897 [Syzygium grande]|nr:hypothetical protein NL676_039897 [Syzygium grande]
MASSSDHDAETLPETDCEDAAAETIFLHGTADNGLSKIYREVKSWRFDLRCSRPEVLVLSKDNICFKLDKPRRSFQDTIRTVLIMLLYLHYAKNHPDASGEALWEHLARTLGFYEVQPSAKGLQDHVALIEEAIGRDDALAKSKPGKQVLPDSEERRAVQPASKKSDDSLPALHADRERRLLNLMKEDVSSASMEDVIREQKVPLTHVRYLKSTVDKAITIEEVEGSVQALLAALQRLEDGDSIEDVKAVCDPTVVTQIFKWKDKLREYLAPFVYGMRYTSFGRQFTKVDELQERPPPSSAAATAEPPGWPSRACGTVTTRDLSLPSGGGALSTPKPYSQDDKLLTLLRQRKTEEAWAAYAQSDHLPNPTCLSRLVLQLSYQKTPEGLARAQSILTRLRDERQLRRLDANSLGLLAVAAAKAARPSTPPPWSSPCSAPGTSPTSRPGAPSSAASPRRIDLCSL